MLKEFKAFVMRGNVMDLAVAVILGAAFNAIVASLVADIITPAILKPVIQKAGVANLEQLSYNGILYGKFIAAILNFLVVAFSIFVIIKMMNKFSELRKKKEAEETAAAPPAPSNEEVLLAEIRDLLKNK